MKSSNSNNLLKIQNESLLYLFSLQKHDLMTTIPGKNAWLREKCWWCRLNEDYQWKTWTQPAPLGWLFPSVWLDNYTPPGPSLPLLCPVSKAFCYVVVRYKVVSQYYNFIHCTIPCCPPQHLSVMRILKYNILVTWVFLVYQLEEIPNSSSQS